MTIKFGFQIRFDNDLEPLIALAFTESGGDVQSLLYNASFLSQIVLGVIHIFYCYTMSIDCFEAEVLIWDPKSQALQDNCPPKVI